MGNAQSDFQNFGKKVSDGFNNLGKKMGEGWEATKNFGNKIWNGVKSVPVLGDIAGAVEKYTPVGWAATSALKGLDTGIGASSKLLQGDLNGAVKQGIDFGREAINKDNPLLEKLKGVPVLGGIVKAGQTAVENIPLPMAGGMSISQLKNIGNTALNSADAFRQGDIKGGFVNAGKVGLDVAGRGFLGKTAQNVANVGKNINNVAKVF